jgi:hypothetical protein
MPLFSSKGKKEDEGEGGEGSVGSAKLGIKLTNLDLLATLGTGWCHLWLALTLRIPKT